MRQKKKTRQHMFRDADVTQFILLYASVLAYTHLDKVVAIWSSIFIRQGVHCTPPHPLLQANFCQPHLAARLFGKLEELHPTWLNIASGTLAIHMVSFVVVPKLENEKKTLDLDFELKKR